MPYNSIEDLPEAIRKLPEKAQEIFMGAFNGAWEQYKDLGPKEREDRAFAVAWSAVRKAGYATANHSFTLPKMKEFVKVKKNSDGSAVFYDAILFAEGTWHAHNVAMPITFTRENILPSVPLWNNLQIWAGHTTNGAHNPAENIGHTTNPRMVGPNLTGDLFAHGKTQASRDAIAMWEAGKMPDLSAELGSTDTVIDGKLMGTDLKPVAVAWVETGACTTCKVHAEHTHFSLNDTHKKTQAGSQTAGAACTEKITGGGHMADEKEMKALQAELDIAKAENKALSGCKDKATKELAETNSKHAEKVKELTKALEDRGELLREERIKELEAQVKIKELQNPEGKIKELAEAKAALEKKTGEEVKELTKRIKELEDMPNGKSRKFKGGEGEKKELHSSFARKGDNIEIREMI